jgi:lipopolysaccharide/colanic/teichoic acid biosynthesis glycosyltransferase
MTNTFYSKYIKRSIDLLASVIGLIIAIPVSICIIFLLRLTGHKKIFFVQKRVGYNEKIFSLIKFCTMTEQKDVNGNLLPDEKRLTKFGKALRKSSLDEIPQLINVLIGKMSLIGPRPLLIDYLPLYNEQQKKRHLLKPGITGWAQVNGRNAISWEKKFELDVWYTQNIGFFLDLKILFLTIKKIFVSEGVNQAGSATMEAFKGS